MSPRNDRVVWILGWIIASGVFSAIVAQVLHVWFWPPFLIMTSLGIASFLALVYSAERRAGLGKLHQMVQEINGIPLDQARRNAMVALADQSLFRASSNESSPNISEMGPVTQEFLLKFNYVESSVDEFYLDGSAITPSSLLDEYLVIGKSSDAEELVVYPGGDQVLLLDGERAPNERILARFQSIYHCILFQS